MTPELFTELFIGGSWVSSASAGRCPIENPATGEVIAEASLASVEDCLSAVDAARAALAGWSEAPARIRAEVLRTAWELLITERDHFARLIVLENGKAWGDAVSEVNYAAEFFRWFAEEAVRVSGDMRRSPTTGDWIMVTHEPAGVALLVTPWNFPAAMATRKLAPALAAGCTVVLKPAVDTPLTALALADLLARAGAPSGVVNVVLPDPPGDAVAAMLGHASVRVLSFTGSTAVGRHLLAEAANNVVHCSMELGGNAPFIVMEDADLDRAVEGLMVAKLRNGGSACTAANRVYVHEPIADDFLSRFDAHMAAIRVGDGLDPGTQVGAMINRKALDKVASLVSSTCAAGARVSTGGGAVAGRGYFFEPTVLVDVPRDAAILHEEIFGPVAPVVRFDDIEDAIALANGTDAGLVAYAYTKDLSRGLELSRRLQAGMVGINKAVVSDPAAPFGGIKQSGLGREGAQQGILEFLETKYTAFPYS